MSSSSYSLLQVLEQAHSLGAFGHIQRDSSSIYSLFVQRGGFFVKIHHNGEGDAKNSIRIRVWPSHCDKYYPRLFAWLVQTLFSPKTLLINLHPSKISLTPLRVRPINLHYLSTRSINLHPHWGCIKAPQCQATHLQKFKPNVAQSSPKIKKNPSSE